MAPTSSNRPDKNLNYEVTQLTIARLLSNMTPTQLWSMLGAIGAIAVAAFGLGFKIHEWQTQIDASKYQFEVEKLKSSLDDLQSKHDMLKSKEQFLRLLYLYNEKKSKECSIYFDIASRFKRLDSYLELDSKQSPFQQLLEKYKVWDKFGICSIPTVIIYTSYSVLSLPNAIKNINSDYISRIGKMKALPSPPPPDTPANKEIADSVAQEIVQEIDQVKEAVIETLEARSAVFELLQTRMSHDDYGVKFGEMSKGGIGWGTIKFAYDGMVISLPNEFLPRAGH